MNAHLMVADDEEPIRELLCTYFRKHGYEVTAVATAAEAIKCANEVPLDLIILDLALDDADGLDVLATLKASHPQLPVVLLTGMGFDEELLQEARQRGADGYVSKTLSLDHLRMEVVRVLKYRKGSE